jgi:hypothetical protein
MKKVYVLFVGLVIINAGITVKAQVNQGFLYGISMSKFSGIDGAKYKFLFTKAAYLYHIDITRFGLILEGGYTVIGTNQERNNKKYKGAIDGINAGLFIKYKLTDNINITPYFFSGADIMATFASYPDLILPDDTINAKEFNHKVLCYNLVFGVGLIAGEAAGIELRYYHGLKSLSDKYDIRNRQYTLCIYLLF